MLTIDVEILEDGTISTKTGSIGQIHHTQADDLIEAIEDYTGTKRKTVQREHTFWKNRAVQRGGKIVKAGQ